MSMICPQCNTTYEQRLDCPLCGVRLLYLDARRLGDRSSARPGRWQQQPWGRIFLGLVLSQGLFYGMHHLLTAALLALWEREAVQQLNASTSGVLLLQGVRFVALLAGAVFAGGGQFKGAFLGAMVGAWSGVFTVLLMREPTQALTPIAVLGQPLLQAGVGVVGGWLGSTIWKPLSAATSTQTPVPRKRNLLRSNLELFKGPVAWLRVGLGAALAVCGTLMATLFFEKILDLGHGALATTDEVQDHLITMEIKALALMLGGALAGSTTRNGIKQGLCVGIVASVILAGIELHYVEHWLQMAGLTTVASTSLCMVGGWFGGQLFPPLVKIPRLGRLGRSMI
jgi:hypothetical protein